MRTLGIAAVAVIVVVVVVVVVVVEPLSPRLNGQSPLPAGPRFEVASIRPGKSPAEIGRAMAAAGGGGGPVSIPSFGVRVQPGGRLVGTANLQTLILRAYGIQPYQLEGGPKWLTTDYFDVTAKAEQETVTNAEMNEMLKSLLAERFNLRVHVETRDAPAYTLAVARDDGRLGSGLKPTSPECLATMEEPKKAGAAAPPFTVPPSPPALVCGQTIMGMNTRTASATYRSSGQPMTALVSRISSELGAPVVDRTGLSGPWDVLLEYENTRRVQGMPAGPDLNSTDPLPVPLPAALQQQLGLKLEKGTGPLPITVIDAADLPSPN